MRNLLLVLGLSLGALAASGCGDDDGVITEPYFYPPPDAADDAPPDASAEAAPGPSGDP